MTPTIIRLNRYFLPFLLFPILFVASNYLFPQVPKYSARPLNTKRPPHLNIHDDSLLVRGIFWELPLAGVQYHVTAIILLIVTEQSISSLLDRAFVTKNLFAVSIKSGIRISVKEIQL